MGIKLYVYVNHSFCFIMQIWLLVSHERTHTITIGKHANTLVTRELEAQIKHSLSSAKWHNAQVLICKIVLFIIKLFDLSTY